MATEIASGTLTATSSGGGVDIPVDTNYADKHRTAGRAYYYVVFSLPSGASEQVSFKPAGDTAEAHTAITADAGAAPRVTPVQDGGGGASVTDPKFYAASDQDVQYAVYACGYEGE